MVVVTTLLQWRPAMLSSAFRLLVFIPIVMYLMRLPGFKINQVWQVSVLSVTLQAVVNYLLVQYQSRLRLRGLEPTPAPSAKMSS
jgi:Na+-driven multidrug efflux pump